MLLASTRRLAPSASLEGSERSQASESSVDYSFLASGRLDVIEQIKLSASKLIINLLSGEW